MVHIYLPVKKSTNTELMAKKRGHPTFDRPRSKKQTTQILRNKVFEWYSGCFFGAIFLVLFWCSKNKSSFLSLSALVVKVHHHDFAQKTRFTLRQFM